MKKTILVADGENRNFYFTFQFFLKSDVIVEVNSQPATNYNLIPNSSGLNADIPFSGGCVCFSKPPKQTDVVTIYRNLPLKRIADYQPTVPYDPKTLNYDFNYLMELIKDLRDDMATISNQPSESKNKEEIDVLSAKFDVVLSVLKNLKEQLDQEPDIDLSAINASIDSLAASISDLSATVSTNSSNITNLSTFKDGVLDYVIESQAPTTANDYTWYRKYASGWVEQGGISSTGTTAAGKKIIFPIPMANSSYNVAFSVPTSWNEQEIVYHVRGATKNQTEINVVGIQQQHQYTVRQNLTFTWIVCGMAA